MAARSGTTKGKSAPAPASAPEPEASAAPDLSKPHLTPDEVRAAHYHKLMAAHVAVDADLEKIDSGRKSVAKRRTEVRNQLKAAGYFLSNVDNVLESGAKAADRKEERDKVTQLHWMREQSGLPVAKTGEQQDMFERLPTTEQEGVQWEEHAYHMGVIGEPGELPAKCPPIFHQRWMEFWHKGKDRRDWAMATEVNVERAKTGTAASRPDLAPEPETCETCKGDGSGLEPEEEVCSTCGAEYEVGFTAEERAAGESEATALGSAADAFDDDDAPADGEQRPAEAPLVH